MTTFTQADIDAAEKRGRAIGQANAMRNFSESLPEAIRIQKEAAWDEAHSQLCEYSAMGCHLHTNPHQPPTTEES